MKSTYALFLVLFTANVCLGQLTGKELNKKEAPSKHLKDTFYLDEMDNIIDQRIFDIKIKTDIYSGVLYDSDSVYVKRLKYSYIIDKLEGNIKSQLYKLLASSSNVDTTKVMIIHYTHYTDSLRADYDYSKDNLIEFDKKSGRYIHKQGYDYFLKNHKRCTKRSNRSDTYNIYHFYGEKKESHIQLENNIWHKDRLGLINKIFRDKQGRYRSIVLHPDGMFYCNNRYHNLENNRFDTNWDLFQDLIKNKNWNQHLSSFKVSVERLNSL